MKSNYKRKNMIAYVKWTSRMRFTDMNNYLSAYIDYMKRKSKLHVSHKSSSLLQKHKKFIRQVKTSQDVEMLNSIAGTKIKFLHRRIMNKITKRRVELPKSKNNFKTAIMKHNIILNTISSGKRFVGDIVANVNLKIVEDDEDEEDEDEEDEDEEVIDDSMISDDDSIISDDESIISDDRLLDDSTISDGVLDDSMTSDPRLLDESMISDGVLDDSTISDGVLDDSTISDGVLDDSITSDDVVMNDAFWDKISKDGILDDSITSDDGVIDDSMTSKFNDEFTIGKNTKNRYDYHLRDQQNFLQTINKAFSKPKTKFKKMDTSECGCNGDNDEEDDRQTKTYTFVDSSDLIES